jgi:hypothetical protein
MSFKIPNLDHFWEHSPLLAEALQSLRDGVDSLGQKLSVNPQGETNAPEPPSAINVAAAGGVTHITLTDKNPRTRQVHYFVEYDTDPNFTNAHTEHLGVARTRRIPTFMGADKPLYVRAYAQYPDGRRSSIIYHGSPHDPTPINDGAVTNGPALPPTTGSGTAQSPGYGFGHDKFVSPPLTPGKPPKTY